MKKPKRGARLVAKELSPADIEKLLARIGKQLKEKRQERTTLEALAYELGMSRSQITKYQDGADMRLSTFLKLLHGLEISPVDFFEQLKK